MKTMKHIRIINNYKKHHPHFGNQGKIAHVESAYNEQQNSAMRDKNSRRIRIVRILTQNKKIK